MTTSTPYSGSGWQVLQSGTGDCAFNMALDEALLEAMPLLGAPVLRFYGWSEPGASFGYFQKYADVKLLTRLRPLTRRPTGGGLVPHESDWTYSLAFPTDHPWYALKAVESYRRVHEWIRGAFEKLAVPTELASQARKAQAGQCFVGHEKSDVLWGNLKIAGAAQRRTRSGLLIQGSIQPPPLSLQRREWERAMCEAAPFEEQARALDLGPDTPLCARAAELVRQKYSRPSYNQKR